MLVGGEREPGSRRPRLGDVEAAASVQEARIGSGVEPVSGRRGQPPACQEVIASVVDPLPQSGPVVEQRLVGHLDRRRAARRVAVEGEQAVAAELVQQGVELVSPQALLLELRPAHPATGVVVVVADVDETQEHPAGVAAEGLVEVAEDRLRPPTEGIAEST